MSPRIVFIALLAFVALTLPARGDQPTTQPAQPAAVYLAPGIVPLGGPQHAPRPPSTAPTTVPSDDVEGKGLQGGAGGARRRDRQAQQKAHLAQGGAGRDPRRDPEILRGAEPAIRLHPRAARGAARGRLRGERIHPARLHGAHRHAVLQAAQLRLARLPGHARLRLRDLARRQGGEPGQGGGVDLWRLRLHVQRAGARHRGAAAHRRGRAGVQRQRLRQRQAHPGAFLWRAGDRHRPAQPGLPQDGRELRRARAARQQHGRVPRLPQARVRPFRPDADRDITATTTIAVIEPRATRL